MGYFFIQFLFFLSASNGFNPLTSWGLIMIDALHILSDMNMILVSIISWHNHIVEEILHQLIKRNRLLPSCIAPSWPSAPRGLQDDALHALKIQSMGVPWASLLMFLRFPRCTLEELSRRLTYMFTYTFFAKGLEITTLVVRWLR